MMSANDARPVYRERKGDRQLCLEEKEKRAGEQGKKVALKQRPNSHLHVSFSFPGTRLPPPSTYTRWIIREQVDLSKDRGWGGHAGMKKKEKEKKTQKKARWMRFCCIYGRNLARRLVSTRISPSEPD